MCLQAASEPPLRDAPGMGLPLSRWLHLVRFDALDHAPTAALSAAAIAAEQRRKAAQLRGCNPVARAGSQTEEEPEAASAGEAARAEDVSEDAAPRLQVRERRASRRCRPSSRSG